MELVPTRCVMMIVVSITSYVYVIGIHFFPNKCCWPVGTCVYQRVAQLPACSSTHHINQSEIKIESTIFPTWEELLHIHIIRDVVYLITGPRTPCQQSLWVKLLRNSRLKPRPIYVSERDAILEKLKEDLSRFDNFNQNKDICWVKANTVHVQAHENHYYIATVWADYVWGTNWSTPRFVWLDIKTVLFIFLPQDTLTFTYPSWRENRNMLQHFWQNHSDAFRIL
jgi:hypothetical protein